MFVLSENETIVVVVRKHWFVMARTAIVFFILALFPALAPTLLSRTNFYNETVVGLLTDLILSLYMMGLPKNGRNNP